MLIGFDSQMSPGLGNALAIGYGLIIGSFLNVVIGRLPKGESLVRPGSRCPNCKHAIRWYENIPVLSYIFLHGKCRSCKAKISFRYPVVELLTALLFLSAKLRFGWSYELVFRDFPFLSILIAVTFIDLDLRIIPDRLSLGGLAWGLLTSVVFSFFPSLGSGTAMGWIPSFMGAAVGFGLFYSLAWIYYRLTGRSGLGGGDIKLLAMLGAYLGVGGVFTTILVSSVFGSLVGISWALLQRGKSGQSVMTVSIPYGPFLVVGGLYHYFLSDLIWFQFMNPM
jgi:leader peptidase (prepilin peptidase)/N-methyltransferase